VYPPGFAASPTKSSRAACPSFWSVDQFGGHYVSWPADGAWTPLPGINDQNDGQAARLDFVGDAANPGGYTARDADYIYFRMRVAEPTVTSGTYSDTVMVLIDKPGIGNADRPDYGFAWDSKSGDNTRHGLEMMIPAVVWNQFWNQNRMDDIDGSSGQKYSRDINGDGRTGDGYIRTVDNQGTANLGVTSFVDIAVSWDYLENPLKGNTSLSHTDAPWRVTFASIQNATDHNPLSTDIAGGANPSDPTTVGWSDSRATIGLSNPVNATIITGGTGTLGATVANTAAAGASNLNYVLGAAVQTGAASLGAVTPGSGSLAPGASAANTVTASSTNVGLNTIRFTATDANATNSPQTADAVLTVLDHSRASLAASYTPTLDLDFGSVHQNETAVRFLDIFNLVQTPEYTVALELDSQSGLSGTKFSSDLTSLTNLLAGTSQSFSITFDTTGLGSYAATYVLGLSDIDLPGANAPGSEILTIHITGTVVSLDTDIPEPATLALLGLAASGLGGYIRRRRTA